MTSLSITFSGGHPTYEQVVTFLLNTTSSQEHQQAMDWWTNKTSQILPDAISRILSREPLKKVMTSIAKTIEDETGFETKYVISDFTAQCCITAL